MNKTIAVGLCAVVFGLVPFAANAQSDGWYDGGGASDGWYDSGASYSDSWYDSGSSYSDGWYDSGASYSDSWYDSGSSYSDGWYDSGSSDGWYDSGSGSDGWYSGSTGTSDGWYSEYDYAGTSDGWYSDYPSSNYSDYPSGSDGWYSDYPTDCGTNCNYSDYPTNYSDYPTDCGTNCNYSDYPTNYSDYPTDCGTSCYTYSESCNCYQQTSAPNTYSQSSSQTPRFTPPSYTPPRTTPIPPSYPQTPHYPQPPVYPQPPRPQPPVPQPPVYIPQQPNVTNTNINTNTCTNNSCNTNVNNIDNSINGSFNTATVVTANPQPIIQYQIPPAQNQGLYCLISASQNSIQSGQTTYLAWSSSYGATSATLSEAGNVPTTGTYAVRPLTTRMYTLTVYGQNGQTASCNVMVNVNNAAPYVSLSQIPYTGIDFDIMGSAVYWATLLSLAIAGGYLVVYYNGGALSLTGKTLASAFAGTRSNYSNPEPVILSETIIPQEVQVAEEVVEAPAPEVTRVDSFAHLPVMTDRSTKDSMSIARDGGVPRIVIART